MAMADPDRDFLFALMALRSNLITSDELLAAVAEFGPEEPGSLGDYLIGRGVLRGEEVATVEQELAAWSGGRTPDRDWSGAPETGAFEVPETRLDPFATRAARPTIGGIDPFATR